MRKSIFIFTLCLLFGATGFAQSLEELQANKAAKAAMQTAKQSEADALAAEIASIQAEINKLKGWRRGVSGLIGFNLNNSNGWIANPNPNAESSGLNFGLTAFAMQDKQKSFWHNKLVIQKAWQKVNLAGENNETSLFDNGTVDLLTLSSLYGYKLSDKIALSGLGELNSSVENFLEPGTFDLGIGATWTPQSNLTIVAHPLNIRGNWWSERSKDAFESVNMDYDNPAFYIGAKLRVDYTRTFVIAGKNVSWSSTLTGFLPYSSEKIKTPNFDDDGLFTGDFSESGPQEYMWINQFSFEIWKGIGGGVGFGLW